MENLKTIKLDKDTITKNIERNCKLVVLSDKIIPNYIQEDFSKTSDVEPSIALTSRDTLLGGTEWWTNDKNVFVPKAFDLFGDQ